MKKVVYETSLQLTLVNCCSCGTTFGIESTMHDRQFVERHMTFYCPSGHQNVYGESLVDKLKKQLAQKELALDQERAAVRELNADLLHEQRRVSAFKGQVTKTKNKIARGICPCCDTYFENLHQHMTKSHPDYESADEI